AAPELLATTRAAPTVWAVTNPVPLTVATAGSSDVQVTTAPPTAWELWSSTAALSCDVSPSAPSVTLSGVERTRATSCATSTRLVSACPLAVATMRATPFDCANAQPDGDTVAIAGSSELHAMTALVTTLPLLSTAD